MLTVKYAKNPVYGSSDGQQIQLIVRFVEIDEDLPFNATSYDCEPHGIDLYNRAKTGEFGEVAPFPIPTV